MLNLASRIALVLLIAAAVAGGIIYHYHGPDRPAGDPGRITIHFTCDSSGRLEPCGCFTGQHGGLTRLWTWLGERKSAGPVLKLDVGGAIAGGADYDMAQYRYLTRAYHLMGFSALNMGGREAMIPAETLVSLAKASPVPLVSASLVDAATRKELLEPYRISRFHPYRHPRRGVASQRSESGRGPGGPGAERGGGPAPARARREDGSGDFAGVCR